MKIGKKIFQLRKKNQLSQEQLAKKVGVSRQTIRKWERDEANPNLEQTQKLSKVFHEKLIEEDRAYSKNLKEKKPSSIFQTDFFWNCMNVLVVLAVVLAFVIGMKISNKNKDSLSESQHNQNQIVEERLICSLNGQVYHFSIQYNDFTGKIVPDSANSDLSNIIDVSLYNDVQDLFSAVHHSVLEQGGSCD